MNRMTMFVSCYLCAMMYLFTVAEGGNKQLIPVIVVSLVLASIAMGFGAVFLWVGQWILGAISDVVILTVTILSFVIACGFYKQVWAFVVPMLGKFAGA